MKRISLLWLFVATICLLFAFACDDNDDDDCNCDEDASPADDDDDDDTGDDDDASPAPPTLSEPAIVVPSDGLPAGVELQNANNNLDVVAHDGRVFLAFRTAPSHFASRRATLYVVSSIDEINWEFEATFHLEKDLREPRLLSWNGRLFLYFAVLGTNPLNFEPGVMMFSERTAPGEWTEPAEFYEEGFIAWRTKTVDGTPYMLAYVGGEGIYDVDPEPMQVHWLTTSDGATWEPVVLDQPVVLEGGCSETDFVFLDDGTLIAVCRNEMGDESGWGSKICRAEAESLSDWQCVNDTRKYDSPLMFRHSDEVYLIGRRNLNDSGDYDLGFDDLDTTLQHLLYELDYWIHPKRTSLWRVDPQTLTVEYVLDLPSRGDTCFPGLIEADADRFIVYNYTSPVDGPDTIWVLGQLGPTQILRQEISFPAE